MNDVRVSPSIRVLLIVLLVLLASARSHAQADPATPALPNNALMRDLTLTFNDGWEARAQLVLPPGDDPFTLVLLVHGGSPYDMDATVPAPDGNAPLSANFRLLAARLAEAGIATLRYDKRGVRADGTVDTAQAQATTLDQLIADADVALDAALMQPEVDPARVTLYGWSEGGWVVTNLAAARPDDVAGVVLQGAPSTDLLTILEEQYLGVGYPYLVDVTDADGDGTLTLDEALAIPVGPTSLFAIFFLLQPQTDPTAPPAVNEFVDANRDGLLDLEGEVRPAVETFLRNAPRFLPPSQASTDTIALVADLPMPVLLLHGDNDGWVQVYHAQAIADDASDAAVTLRRYPGLGHALSITDVLAEDALGVMDDAPIADLVAWLTR